MARLAAIALLLVTLSVAYASRPARDENNIELERDAELEIALETSSSNPKDPEVVKLALQTVWENKDGGRKSKRKVKLPSPATGCYVDTLPSINGKDGLGRVRRQWQEDFPGDFMDDPSPADALIAKFSKLTRITEGSKSGSDIYKSDGAQLLLKSEGSKALNVFWKRRPGKRGRMMKNVFGSEYVDRVTSADVEEADRQCERSSLMRFLLVFTVRCSSGFLRSDASAVWMLFSNVSPFASVPTPLHMFDLKASRSMSDCHQKKWTAKNSMQGYLGDFLSLYLEPIHETECAPMDFLHTTRKACFMRALHKDLRLLARYNLIDYSFFVSVYSYRGDVDDEAMQKYSNLVPLNFGGEKRVMTIGTIDLLKDYDAEFWSHFQNTVGYNFESVFGQRKFDSYPYYLFCLAVDLLDPPCANARSLQLLSKCKKGDDPRIYFPEGKNATSSGKRLMDNYLMEADYCDLVNSCNALVRVPDANRNLNVCQLHACKTLGLRRCPDDLDGKEDLKIWSKLGLVAAKKKLRRPWRSRSRG